jgi:hypothetical protein
MALDTAHRHGLFAQRLISSKPTKESNVQQGTGAHAMSDRCRQVRSREHPKAREDRLRRLAAEQGLELIKLPGQYSRGIMPMYSLVNEDGSDLDSPGCAAANLNDIEQFLKFGPLEMPKGGE